MKRMYEVSWNGATAYVYAASHAKAKGWAIPHILRALGRTRGASFAGLRCRLAEHCPPDQGAHYAEVSP